MKKILMATAVAATLVAPQAFAQSAGFSGFGFGLNGYFATTATELSAPAGVVKFGEGSQNASLQAAYGFALGPNGVLGLGVTYNLGDLKGGTFSSAGTSFEMKGKDMYSVYFEPGYALNNAALLYAKIAYVALKGEVSGGGATNSENFDGVGYGFGVRAKLEKNVFLQIEFMQQDYDAKTMLGASVKPSGTFGTVGIGYQF